LGSILFGDLLVGCDSNGKPLSGEETRMHYAHRRRVKIWGEAQVVENDAELIAKPTRPGYRARPEQVMLFKVLAWDWNCSQHIPQRFEVSDVEAALAERDRRIAVLEAEIERLR
jgi:uncharacterized protein